MKLSQFKKLSVDANTLIIDVLEESKNKQFMLDIIEFYYKKNEPEYLDYNDLKSLDFSHFDNTSIIPSLCVDYCEELVKEVKTTKLTSFLHIFEDLLAKDAFKTIK